MRKYYLPILLPDLIAHIGVWFLLRYRQIKYGYPFRMIKLTQKKFAIVDQGDYEDLMKYKWHAHKEKTNFYAARKGRASEPFNTLVMHRAIMNPPKDLCVDHINHNGLDNRRANLRLATSAQNNWNRSARKWRSSSKYKGVSWDKKEKRWIVSIRCHGKIDFLGRFKNETEAARAYDNAAKKLHGEFAYLNFPSEK